MHKEKHLKRNICDTLLMILTDSLSDFGEIILNMGANFIERIDLIMEEFGQNIRL